MWKINVTRVTSAPPEAIWHYWTNLDTWPQWIKFFEWARLDGPLAVGTWGEIKVKRFPGLFGWIASRRPYRWKITMVEEGVGFDDILKQFLATFYFYHHVETTPAGTQLTQRIEIKGPLGWFYARLIGPMFEQGLPEAVDTLVKLAEQEGQAG